jgi:hypothetical protein
VINSYLLLREDGTFKLLPDAVPGAALHRAKNEAAAQGWVGWLAWVSGSLEYKARRCAINMGRIGAPYLNFMRVVDEIGRPPDAPVPKRKGKKAAKVAPKLEVFGL